MAKNHSSMMGNSNTPRGDYAAGGNSAAAANAAMEGGVSSSLYQQTTVGGDVDNNGGSGGNNNNNNMLPLSSSAAANGGGGGNNSNVLKQRRGGNTTTAANIAKNHSTTTTKSACGCCAAATTTIGAGGYDAKSEWLEYDYTQAAAQQQQQNNGTLPQALPRIRERGEFYVDSYNDQPMQWSFGTNEHNGTWCNSSDQAGTIMSAMVWLLMLYSAFTVTALTATEGIPKAAGEVYAVLVFMSLASHAKTSFTDPGSVPVQAIPVERQRLLRDSHSMCGQCQTFKPPGSHHCRICNRCISRMDHHCPWMNNCVGAGNLKHFILFLIYTWSCAAYSLLLFGWNYFFCADEDCTFHPVVLHLVRIMTLLAVGAFLFTSSMLMNVCYGIMTGIGTIDRLKKKATNTMSQSDEEPIELKDVFGIGGIWTWPFPVDPVFDEYDHVMGYTMPQRLDRERQLMEANNPLSFMNAAAAAASSQPSRPPPRGTPGSVELMPKCVNDLLPV